MACRTKATQETLLRFAKGDGDTLSFDGRRTMGGRGAWLCKSAKCLRRAIEKRAFQRALRCQLTVPPEEVLLAEVGIPLTGIMDGK